jgi:CrcB protein
VALLVEHPFPWGTWTVNLAGCFLIGMTVPLFGRLSAAEGVRFFLVVGFLGSFTTFSTLPIHEGNFYRAVSSWQGTVLLNLKDPQTL